MMNEIIIVYGLTALSFTVYVIFAWYLIANRRNNAQIKIR